MPKPHSFEISGVLKKKQHTTKTPYISFQEKCLSFPICLRLMSTHKRLKSGLDENGQAYNIKNLSFLNWGTIPYTEADLVLQKFFPKLLYLLLISNESANTSVSYYSPRPMLFIFLFSELISLFPQHLLTAPSEIQFRNIQVLRSIQISFSGRGSP